MQNDRKQQARGEFDKWLASANIEQVAKSVPTDSLYLAASLSDFTVLRDAVTNQGPCRALAEALTGRAAALNNMGRYGEGLRRAASRWPWPGRPATRPGRQKP